jgi:hypothetical protein
LGKLLFNNVRCARGDLFSVSLLSDDENTANAASGYGGRARTDLKEQEFERIRKEHFQDRPSRINGLFVFDDLHTAECAAVRWFSTDPRIILEARLVVGASIHRGDAIWLDRAELGDWIQCASAYWDGQLTDDPLIEVVVKGRVFFPRWEEFPTPEEVEAGKLKELVDNLGTTGDEGTR